VAIVDTARLVPTIISAISFHLLPAHRTLFCHLFCACPSSSAHKASGIGEWPHAYRCLASHRRPLSNTHHRDYCAARRSGAGVYARAAQHGITPSYRCRYSPPTARRHPRQQHRREAPHRTRRRIKPWRRHAYQRARRYRAWRCVAVVAHSTRLRIGERKSIIAGIK